MESTDESKYIIRVATLEDMPRLLEIYSYYVAETTISFEYVVPTLEEFADRFKTIIKKYPYLVMEKNGEIVGYAYANTYKGRAAYDWCVETTIYLDKIQRGKGAGTQLYTALESYLKKQNILNLNACITYPNPRSIQFHERLGYEKNAHFHKCGYKFNEWHDMIWMEKIIGEHKLDMEDVIWFENL
ncbi:MAG: N-acetyltransferase family protein [Eubacteriales bacterium]